MKVDQKDLHVGWHGECTYDYKLTWSECVIVSKSHLAVCHAGIWSILNFELDDYEFRSLTPSQILEDDVWSGEALPPIGSKVKVVAPAFALDSLSRFSGKECLVVGHFHFDGNAGYVLSHPTNGIGAFFLCPDVIEPIKSDRDKAIEKAESAIKGMRMLATSADARKDIATCLFEAGLLKLPEGDK